VIEKGECDFVTEIAAALPLKIICDMMGIPESQYRFVFDRTNVILGAGDPEYVSEPAKIIPALLSSGAELAQLMNELGALRRKDPTDDLTSALLHAEVDGETLTDQELASFFVLLVVAGNETTRNAISHGMKALCDYPAERARWAADVEGLAPTAVDEIVRWATPVIHFRRTATQDTVLSGQKIREGEKVVLWYNSGNRDESVWSDPFRFDVGRDPNPHVGFGGPGPHFCLGAHLARREITVMFREIFRRLPDLRVTGEADRLASFFIHGIKHMTCEFTPGNRAS
jgi:cytochrome P450